ncbi:MAG: YbbR-like domain-containing protein [Eubacteriaceae bacterium]
MKSQRKKNEPKLSIIVSVLIAIIIWIYVIGEVDPNITQKFNNIPVTFKNQEVLSDYDLILSESKDYSVDVTVSGRTSVLYNLRNDISASIDLSSIDSKNTYDLQVTVEGIPDIVALVEVSPSNIQIEVDKLTQREYSLDIDVLGGPSKGYAMLGYNVSASNITISGPENILESINQVSGEIDIDGAKDDLNKSVELFAYDKDNNKVEGIITNPKKVDVTVAIGKTKSVEIIPQISGTPMEGYVIAQYVVSTENITIGAKSDFIADIETINTEDINIDKINTTLEKKVKLILPEGVKVVDGESTVTVKILVEKIQKKEYEVSNVEFVNKPDNFDIELQSAKSFKVVLEGKEEDLQEIISDDIHLQIDLKNIVIGENTLDVQMEKIDNISVITIEPEKVVITATEKLDDNAN